MNRCKKISALLCVLFIACNLAACGQGNGEKTVGADIPSANRQESNGQAEEPLETEGGNAGDGKEPHGQADGNTGAGRTAEELLDLFINGSISAVSAADAAETFYITDLNMDSEEWDSYSIGERADLDNDGEEELILCGPYGGIYLDARDDRVYEFAAGEGTSLVLSYVVYHGDTWILYSNRTHTGYESYHMEKFEGADNLVAEMDFSEELVDEDNAEGEETYVLNGKELSYEEYYDFSSKIFAAEVITD